MPLTLLGDFSNSLKDRQLISFGRITDGVTVAGALVMGGGTNTVLRSQNYDGSDNGWAIFGDGSASFYGLLTIGDNAIVLGDVYSSNWNGTIPANLATEDAGASAGYYLDSSVGSLQLEGDFFLGGNANVTGNVVISGTLDVESTTLFTGTSTFGDDTDRTIVVAGDTGRITWSLQTAGGSEPDDAAYQEATWSSGSASGHITLLGYQWDAGVGDNQGRPGFRMSSSTSWAALPATFEWFSFAQNGTTEVPMFKVEEMDHASYFINAIFGDQTVMYLHDGWVLTGNGTTTLPSFSFVDDTNTGFRRHTENQIGVILGGVENFVFRGGGTSAVLEANVGNLFLDVLEANHDFYVRTENGGGIKNRMFIDGSADVINFYDHDGASFIQMQDPEMNLRLDANSDNHISINFNMERAWETRQRSTGASTSLEFWTTTNKSLYFSGSSNGDMFAVTAPSTDASTLQMRDGLTDIGAHEILRINKGTGTTMQVIGYSSSRAVDLETGRHLKTDLIKAKHGGDVLGWIDRIDPTWFQKTQTLEALGSVDGKGGWDFGFVLEELAEVSPYLTSKPGEAVGFTPDELALIAVLWESNRDLRARVKSLEERELV
jgi:hypothetical protein